MITLNEYTNAIDGCDFQDMKQRDIAFYAESASDEQAKQLGGRLDHMEALFEAGDESFDDIDSPNFNELMKLRSIMDVIND